jgi:hypothetical protein
MTTDELINVLRDEAHKAYPLAVSELMSEAADRLEELDERNAILLSNMDNAWGNNYG